MKSCITATTTSSCHRRCQESGARLAKDKLRETHNRGKVSATDAVDPADGVAACYAPRRIILHQILVNAAVEAEGVHMQGLLWKEEQVTGIRGFQVGGKTISEKATLVIGTDGKRSVVARLVQVPTYSVAPTFTCGYDSY